MSETTGTTLSIVPVPAGAQQRELHALRAEPVNQRVDDSQATTALGALADIELLPGETFTIDYGYGEISASTQPPVAARPVVERAGTDIPPPKYHANRRALRRGLAAIERVRTAAPVLAVTRAEWWLENLSELLSIYNLELRAPHVTTTDCEVVFEWWIGDRKLTNYFSARSHEYVKVWGADVDDEMEDGTLDLKVAHGLWRWLLGKG